MHYKNGSAPLGIRGMSANGRRRRRNIESTKGLEPEVVEFCHMLARILARSARLPSHEPDNGTGELKGNLGMTTRDVPKKVGDF